MRTTQPFLENWPKLYGPCLGHLMKHWSMVIITANHTLIAEDLAIFNEHLKLFFTGELKNLKDYCLRMKTTFWPDWDQCLSAAQRATKKNK